MDHHHQDLHNHLNSAHLRGLDVRGLALHLRSVSKDLDAKEVSNFLLGAIEREVIPPTFYLTFLTAVDGPPLLDALQQQFSKYVRRAAICQLGVQLRSAQWESTWHHLGGTQGLLSLFAQLSVMEVKELCRAIGRCKVRSRATNTRERERKITELLKALLPSIYPETLDTITDQRPLHHCYAQITPACEQPFIEDILCRDSHPLSSHIPQRQMIKSHTQYLGRLIGDTVAGKPFPGDEGAARRLLLYYLPPFLQSEPSLPGNELKFSASMSFAETVLQEIASNSDSRFPIEFSKNLLEPLLRRLNSRKVHHHRIGKTVDLAIEYYRQHTEDAKQQLQLHKTGLIFHAIRCWSEDPALFEPRVAKLLGLRRVFPDERLRSFANVLSPSQYMTASSDIQIFDAAKPSFRYNLLRLLCQHTLGAGYNIDDDKELNDMPISTWPAFAFKIVGEQNGLALLKRLIRLKPAHDFLKIEPTNDRMRRIVNQREDEMGSTFTILSHPAEPNVKHGDSRLLMTYLERSNVDNETQARAIVDEVLEKAAKSRDQNDRAFFASSAIFHAVASGSLDLYNSVVIWMRRFLGDHKVVETVYSAEASSTVEAISLLSGIPEQPGSGRIDSVRNDIVKGNNILMKFLETATMALQEPAFNYSIWYGALTLFREVVMARVSKAGKLKRCFQLSENQLYDYLWAPTTTMLIEAERIGLSPEHSKLRLDSALGPLLVSASGPSSHRYFGGKFSVDPPLPSTYRFLDDLARSRDSLWQELRPTWDPIVTTLPLPFPRGLPIQCLTKLYKIDDGKAAGHTPFLAERAQRVVFIEPDIALKGVPTDKDTQSAIGGFVDSYQTALAIHILQRAPDGERELASVAVASHAMNELSANRLDSDEATRFWKKVFGLKDEPPMNAVATLFSKLIMFSKSEAQRDYPLITRDIDPEEPTEWDPERQAPPRIEAKKLAPTVVDSLLAINPDGPTRLQDRHHSIFDDDIKTLAWAPKSIWEWEDGDDDNSSPSRRWHQQLPFPVREGRIVASLLYQSSMIGSSKRILASAFPSKDEVRYPSIYLDEAFLQSSEKADAQPIKELSCFIDLVPPTLLLELTTSALDELSKTPSNSTKMAERLSCAYNLLKLLSRSDRPQYASKLIVREILDSPRASSWHRQLLGKAFLASLPAQDAQSLMSMFADMILDKLESQAKLPKAPQTGLDPVPKPQPLVKVTTVKFLAQLLDGAAFVSSRFSIKVLSKLFHKSTHVDIRYAVMDSLLVRLEHHNNSPEDPIVEEVMSALEAFVPVLSALNERRLTTSDDWEHAERAGELPDVYSDKEQLPPLIGLLHDKLRLHTITTASNRGQIFDRVIIPALEKSKVENARWVQLFMRQHSASVSSSHPPSLPAKPQVLARLIQVCYNELPYSILDLYKQFLLINTNPPAEVVAINGKVLSDMKLRESNEGKHWLSLYGRRHEPAVYDPFATPDYILSSMLTQEWKPSRLPDNGVELSHVQDLMFTQAIALLQTSDVTFKQWSIHLASLKPPDPVQRSESIKQAWLTNCRPVVERIVDHVDTLRTEEWQSNPKRKPDLLPDTFPNQLWLFPLPYLSRSAGSSISRTQPFAKEVLIILREIMQEGLSSHAHFEELKKAVLNNDNQDKAWIALHLANDPNDNKYEYVLRTELAHELLKDFRFGDSKWAEEPQSAQLRPQLVRLVRSWKSSVDERIRMRGWRLAQESGFEETIVGTEVMSN